MLPQALHAVKTGFLRPKYDMDIHYETHVGYEQVVAFTDDDFRAYVAIHSTRLGPAVGGCRIKPYLSSADALLDALRLAKAMTYKSSLAGVNLGGGKMVVIADRPTREIMLKVGEVINHFNGSYIIAEDVGSTLEDILIAREVTPHTVTRDGSFLTARGVLSAMLTAAKFDGQWGQDLDGVPIWVQGLGKVGMPLALLLSKLDWPNLYVSDLRADLVAQAKAAGAYEIGETDKKFIAIYAPCALGSVINAGNVHTVPYTIICGSANNQLADESYAEMLHQREVLYCPDWLVNAGGVIGAACEIGQDYDQTKAEEMADDIGLTLLNVLKMAKDAKATPLKMAVTLAEARL